MYYFQKVHRLKFITASVLQILGELIDIPLDAPILTISICFKLSDSVFEKYLCAFDPYI